MESPVRSVEAGESGGGGGGGSGGAGSRKEDQQRKGSSSAAGEAKGSFEAKSYLERQVEELSCADEDEAQEKVSKRLQLKQEQAQKKRCVCCVVRRRCVSTVFPKRAK